VIGTVRRRLGESLAAFRDVFANPAIRRLQLAWIGSMVGGTAYVVALLVYAYDQNGAYAVGVIGVVRWLAAGLLAPVAGVLADRFPRVRVMVLSDLVRAVLTALMGVIVLTDGPALAVYALSILVSASSTAFRPAEAALLPSLATTPQELTAANVTASTIESVGWFVGPAIGGLLLAVTSVGTSMIVMSALFIWSALLVARIPEAPRVRAGGGAAAEEEADEYGGVLEGGRILLGESRLRLLVGLFAAQTFVDGALTVLVVVLALETLDLGDAGVGYLNSASGIGGLIGAVVVGALVGRARLATDFGGGVIVWGLPLIVIGLWPEPAVALVALGFVGAANTVVDVAGDTLLQRAVPEEVLARVFGVLESLTLVSVALGSLLAPILIDASGTRVALIATGAVLPVLSLLTWGRLRAIDDEAAVPTRELELLRGLPMFAPLPPPTLEYLAGRLHPVAVAGAETIFHEGDPGDLFYVIADGRVQVLVGGRPARELGTGDYFGEIALLREVPRTATVTALTDVELYALDGDQFVAAVTGHAESAAAADSVVSTRLGIARSTA